MSKSLIRVRVLGGRNADGTYGHFCTGAGLVDVGEIESAVPSNGYGEAYVRLRMKGGEQIDIAGSVAQLRPAEDEWVLKLIKFVQSNHEFFGNPPAGANVFELALGKLEEGLNGWVLGPYIRVGAKYKLVKVDEEE